MYGQVGPYSNIAIKQEVVYSCINVTKNGVNKNFYKNTRWRHIMEDDNFHDCEQNFNQVISCLIISLTIM